jgi:peroxiredoxin
MKTFLFKRWNIISIVILLIGAAWIWVSVSPVDSTTSGKIPAPHTGFLAPDISLIDTNGKEVTLSDLRGTPIMLNFWASWCSPCRAEMPAMQNAYELYKEKGFIILAVNATNQDNQNAVIKFISDHGLTFPVLLDTYGQASNDYQIHSLPTSFFIDQNGIITDVVIGGPLAEALLNIRINELLEQTS